MPEVQVEIDGKLKDPLFSPQGSGLDRNKRRSIQLLQNFFRQEAIQAALERTGVTRKDRLMIFGDIHDEKERNAIKNLLIYMPLVVNPEHLRALIEMYVGTILEEADIYEPELKANLICFAYRNVKKNYDALMRTRGIIPEVRLPVAEKRTTHPSRARDEIFEELVLEAVDFDEEVTEEEELGARVDTRAAYERSWAQLIKIATDFSKTGESLSEKEALGLLLTKLIQSEAAEHANLQNLGELARKTLKEAAQIVRTLGKELEASAELLAEYSEEATPREQEKLDPDSDLAIAKVAELIKYIATADRNDPEQLKKANQYQVFLMTALSLLSIRTNRYIEAAEDLSYDYGRALMGNSMFAGGRRRKRKIFIDDEGRKSLKKKGRSKEMEFRIAEIGSGATLGVNWTDEPMRVKPRKSIESKQIREPDMTVEDIFDAWASKCVIDRTTDWIQESPARLAQIERFIEKSMKALPGMFKRREAGTPREELKPGEYVIVHRLSSDQMKSKSNGLKLIKVYFRSHKNLRAGVRKGIAGEWQIIPLDSHLRMENQDDPTHRRFYTASRPAEIVRAKFSESLFPKLMTFVNYIRRAASNLKRRS